MSSFPDEIVEHIFGFISSHRDRNSLSLVCKSWFKLERWSRERVFIGNCYAISPERLISRFPRIKSLTLKGKPHFADFNLVPPDWGGEVYPWIEAMAKSNPWLEELRLKRMIVSDECLELLSRSFPNFKSLVLISCDGFTTEGIAAVAANCRNLRELDLQENDIEDHRGHWLSYFPDSCTSLVRLNFACLKGEVNFGVLERLVARCPNLKSLRLNRAVPLEVLYRILLKAPQLVDLGTGGYAQEPRSEHLSNIASAFLKCKSVRGLSGFWEVAPTYLQSVYSVCANLTSLNLSYATIPSDDLIKLVCHCPKLQRLWVLDHIGDRGLEVVASTCKELQELRVFPSDPYGAGHAAVTEEGLVAVSKGCPAFHSVLYFCHQMTNAALIAIAKNCPRFTRFRLCIIEPKKPDHTTGKPLDEGFGAIVQSCKDLRRLSVSGLLTDQAFFYIGKYAKRLEMLSVAFAGDGDLGMQHVLRGCENLRKLEIRDSPFGDGALLADVAKYETMRSLWMSSCDVTFHGCKLLAEKVPSVNVEIINDRDPMEESISNSQRVEKLYVYRTLVGPREDAPSFVWTVQGTGRP